MKLRINALYAEEGFLNAKITSELFTFFTADTIDEDIDVVWQNKSDLSDEYHLLYESGDRTYTNLIPRIKDRILLKLSIEEAKLFYEV